ncbi:MAG: hypothetical protein HYX66_08885 [Ignavibacteria bacterium]|nr:hypothetical protein [Ignavibacteria bacterium]
MYKHDFTHDGQTIIETVRDASGAAIQITKFNEQRIEAERSRIPGAILAAHRRMQKVGAPSVDAAVATGQPRRKPADKTEGGKKSPSKK